jgi:hypothetical protein
MVHPVGGAVCGSGVPPYDFLNCMVFLTACFARVFPEKRLELKSLKGQTKAQDKGTPGPFLLNLRLSLKAL